MADHGAAEDDGTASGHAAAAGHGDEHGDEHGHGAEALGPVDVTTWGLAILGIVLGLIVAWSFVAAAS